MPCRGKRSWPGPRPGAPRPVDWSRRGISQLRRRVTFSAMRKSPKNRRGTAPDEHFVLIVALPRTPITKVTPLARHKISGAQNQECSGAIPSGPTGGLSLQNLEHLRFKICAWLCRTNAPGTNPGRAGLGPAPTRKTQPFSICRRGGPMWPPASLPPCRGKVPSAARRMRVVIGNCSTFS